MQTAARGREEGRRTASLQILAPRWSLPYSRRTQNLSITKLIFLITRESLDFKPMYLGLNTIQQCQDSFAVF